MQFSISSRTFNDAVETYSTTPATWAKMILKIYSQTKYMTKRINMMNIDSC